MEQKIDITRLLSRYFMHPTFQKNIFDLKSSRNTFERGTQFFWFFWSSKLFFFEIWHPFHSFIYYYNLLLLFLSWEKFLHRYHHTHIENCFPLMFTMIREPLLRAQTLMLFPMKQWVHTDWHIDLGNFLCWRPNICLKNEKHWGSKCFSPNTYG